MSEEVAKGFSAAPNSSAVIERLGDMLRSRSQWAQADAAGCLGWLVTSLAGGTALHELVPLVAQLMVKHTTSDDEMFIREEKQRAQQLTARDRNHSRRSGGGDGGGRRFRNGGGGSHADSEGKDEQARERMDNIRVYTLILLLKASHADPSTMPAMVEAGAIPALLKHLASGTSAAPLTQGQQQEEALIYAKQRSGACGHRCPPVREVVDKDDVDQTPPSLLLAARLLYAFSLDPGVRSSLLQAKSLPPLIRLRRQLQGAAAATAINQQPASARKEDSDSDLGTAARGKGGSALKSGALGGERSAQPQGSRAAGGGRSNAVVALDENNVQPPLEAMVGLIVDQIVGRGSLRPSSRNS
ncbi:unnamed protein product [Scytosiphon promiscuus]